MEEEKEEEEEEEEEEITTKTQRGKKERKKKISVHEPHAVLSAIMLKSHRVNETNYSLHHPVPYF